MSDMAVELPKGEPLIQITRTFAAPRLLVWKVFTEAEHYSAWFGLHGSRNKVTHFDVRPGGRWRVESTGSEGQSVIFLGTYLEVIKPEKLVNTFGMEGFYEDKLIVETHTFEERDGVTHYRSVSRMDSLEDRDGFVASGMEGGARQSFERIDALLAKLA